MMLDRAEPSSLTRLGTGIPWLGTPDQVMAEFKRKNCNEKRSAIEDK